MDFKQLKYFIACVETGSFSEAAQALYSTQSSVSKVIRQLEDSLGLQLFERLPRGIRLTAQGRRVYPYACRLVNEMQGLEKMAGHGMTKWLHIAINPSTWFADQFVDFYNENYDKNYHFQVTAAGVRTVMERVRDYQDDIGFVYILEQQKEDFLHELSGNRLTFTLLQKTEIILYPGGGSSLCGAECCGLCETESGVDRSSLCAVNRGNHSGPECCGHNGANRSRIRLEEAAGMRFVQNYQDEFFDIEALGERGGFGWNGLDISVLTNSDTIMNRMLQKSNIANISGRYLTEARSGTTPGIPLDLDDNKVLFGYILHKGETPDESILELVDFLKKRIG